ncbi:MAG: response regulator transcription factor [Ignavibacteriaceae bacterium]
MSAANKRISVVIADDHPIFRKGLITILQNNNDFEIICETDNGNDAAELIEKYNPDAAVLDIDMPGKSGVEVAETLRGKNLTTAVIFLTMFKEKDLFDEAMELGVKGYVLKDSALTEITDCIRAAAKGEFYISPALSTFVVQRSAEIKQFKINNPSIGKLTPSELTILKLIAQHKTSKEIAGNLNISVRTVEHHRANIAEKLDLKGSQALLKFALENKSML